MWLMKATGMDLMGKRMIMMSKVMGINRIMEWMILPGVIGEIKNSIKVLHMVLTSPNNLSLSLIMVIFSGCFNKQENSKVPECNKLKLSFSTNINAGSIKSIYVCHHSPSFHGNSLINNEQRIFTHSQEKGLDPPNWFVEVDDSIKNGSSLTIRYLMIDSVKVFKLENIIIDTLQVYNGIICSEKSYFVNGRKKDLIYLKLLSMDAITIRESWFKIIDSM
jgi:hypothetical protein